MEILQQLALSIERGEDDVVEKLTTQAVASGLPINEILDNGLIAGMNVVGEKFKAHVIFLPDVLLAARAMYAGMAVLKPLMIRDGIPTRGTIVLGTAEGDLHDIGKNLVATMLRGAGFEVIDLGNDVTPERFVKAAVTHNAGIIGVSALLTTTMPTMKRVVELARSSGNGRLKTIVGGAPVSRAFADEIGADAYGYDGQSAVDIVKQLIGGR